jgi:8-oxo-dGTP pyrophosphatase MutT (NUDIX family)
MDVVFRDKLFAAVSKDAPGYDERRRVEGGKPASVLMLFGAPRENPSDQQLLITRRTDSVGSHKGQMAFPGGTAESHELSMGPRGYIGTALRETHEEIGIPSTAIATIGTLPELSTITLFRVTPVVGMLRTPIEDAPFQLNPHEIAEAFWVKLSVLQEPRTYRQEYIRVGAINYPIHVYLVNGHRIWGATGSMIKNLLDRLQTLS